jgi:hypothetical protein
MADGRLALRLETDFEIGGAYLVLRTSETLDWHNIDNFDSPMTLDFRQEDDLVKILVYSLDGATLPAGGVDLVAIEGLHDYEIEIADLASSDGRLVAAELAAVSVELPEGFSLHQNYPNPFNPETRISFDLPVAGQVRLSVYNVLGRQIRNLAVGDFPAGSHSVIWDGRDEFGGEAASGVYFYRLEAGEVRLSRKMVLLK